MVRTVKGKVATIDGVPHSSRLHAMSGLTTTAHAALPTRYDGAVEIFADTREAKKYLIGEIVAEAQRENVPLSDVEREMLYFTETAWMPEDTWEANSEFDRTCDPDAYELKIANLIQRAREYDPSTKRQWAQAINALDREDHYLSVMIHYENVRLGLNRSRPPHDFIKLVLTALLVVALLMAGIVVYSHFTGS